MPPQDASASDASVNAFLSLKDDQRKDMLGKLSPEAKTALLAGINSRGKKELAPKTDDDAAASGLPAPPDSILGGFGRRAVETGKGVAATFAPPTSTGGKVLDAALPFALPAYRMLKGAAGAEAEAGKQTYAAAKEGDIPRAVTTGVSMLDPFATGTVTDINRLKDEGRTREAIGTAAFDTLVLLVGARLGRETPAGTRLAKLTSAAGETGETAANLKSIMPEIEKTVAAVGKPTTIGDLRTVTHNVLENLDGQFNKAMETPVSVPQQGALAQRGLSAPKTLTGNTTPFGGAPTIPYGDLTATPTEIAQKLRAQITSNMYKTAEGRADAAAIEAAAKDFEKPWSIRELDLERRTRNSKLSPLYKKSSTAASSAVSAHVQTLIDETVRNSAANIVYRGMDLANPGMDATALKLKEKSAWHLRDQLDKRIDKLEDKQLAQEGKTTGEKVRTHAYAAGSGVRAHVSGLTELIPGGGPMKYANTKVASAFGPSMKGAASRTAVLSLPLTRLGKSTPFGDGKRGIPPPPSDDDDQ